MQSHTHQISERIDGIPFTFVIDRENRRVTAYLSNDRSTVVGYTQLRNIGTPTQPEWIPAETKVFRYHDQISYRLTELVEAHFREALTLPELINLQTNLQAPPPMAADNDAAYDDESSTSPSDNRGDPSSPSDSGNDSDDGQQPDDMFTADAAPSAQARGQAPASR